MRLIRFLIIFSLSFSVFSKSNTDSSYTLFIDDGITYKLIIKNNPSNRIHIVSIDLNKSGYEIDVALSNDTIGGQREKVTSFVKRMIDKNDEIIAAINGDFFGGTPSEAENISVVSGKLAKGVSLNRSVFAILKSKKPAIEKFRFHGFLLIDKDSLFFTKCNQQLKEDDFVIYNKFFGSSTKTNNSVTELILYPITEYKVGKNFKAILIEKSEDRGDNIISDSTLIVSANSEIIRSKFKRHQINDTFNLFLGTTPDYGEVDCMIGGFPRLIINGEYPQSFMGIEGIKSEKFTGINPRTAVGINYDSTKLYLIVADGRQKNFSEGLSLSELSKILIEEGIYNAINLDGGGSSTLVINGNIINSPSDLTGERPVNNFLFVRRLKNNK